MALLAVVCSMLECLVGKVRASWKAAGQLSADSKRWEPVHCEDGQIQLDPPPPTPHTPHTPMRPTPHHTKHRTASSTIPSPTLRSCRRCRCVCVRVRVRERVRVRVRACARARAHLFNCQSRRRASTCA